MTRPIPSDERIVGAMVQLAGITRSHRMIGVGPHCSEVLLGLHRCGYTCNIILPSARADFTNTLE
jgi:hypothetical protein